jgi:hypothetical protein
VEVEEEEPEEVEENEEPSSGAVYDYVGAVRSSFVTHGPQKFLSFIGEHASSAGFLRLLTDLRAKLATAESVVLVLIYLEFAAFVLSQISWLKEPVSSLIDALISIH